VSIHALTLRRLSITACLLLAAPACVPSTPATLLPIPAATDAAQAPSPTTTEASGATPASTATPALPPPPEGMRAVWVYFTMADDADMTPLPAARTVPSTEDPVELVSSTLEELLAGPNDAERDAGMASWFSPATAGTLAGVTADGGTFTADFAQLNAIIPNASTSAGSLMLLSQLNGTVFQFEFVQTIRYTLGGDCAAFWEWLQMVCHPVTRAEWEAG
jgi:hypothetical protein